MDASIQAMIVQEATAQGVDPNLAVAVANAESGGTQYATQTPPYCGPVSPAGAIGVFQLMPSSFPGVDWCDTATNIRTGIAYLKQLSSQYGGDLQKVLAAYNWGPANVNNAVASGGASWFMNIPSSVQRYASGIISAAGSAVQTVATSVLSDLFGGVINVGAPSLATSPGGTSPALVATPWLILLGLAVAAYAILSD